MKKPVFHPIQPELNQIIEKTEELLNRKNFDCIYVSTEDQNLLDGITEWADRKGKSVLYNPDDIRLTKDEMIDMWILDELEQKQIDYMTEQKNYLISILLLKKADFLLSGKTSASRFLSLMKDYKYSYFFELGQYK